MDTRNTQVGLIDSIKALLGKGQDAEGMIYKEGRLLKCKSNAHSHYSVKEGTKVICNGAFSGKTRLNSISLPDSLTSIGFQGFAGCKSLKELHLPKNFQYLEINAIPKTISQIVIWNDKFTDLTPRSFEGYGAGNSAGFNKDITVKVPFKNIEKIKSNLGEIANVTNLNSRKPFKLGTNPAGEELTFARLKLSLSGNVKVIRIDKKEVYIVSDSYTKIGLSVIDSGNNILFSDSNIVVDGFINGFESIKDMKVRYLNDFPSLDIGEIPTHPGSFLPQIFIKKILDKVKKDKEQMQKFEIEVMEVPDNHTLNLEFTLRFNNGVFDPSKLSFISFDNPLGDINGRLNQLGNENKYLLNFIVYDNKIYECRVETDGLKDDKNYLIEKIILKPQINIPKGGVIATFNVKESYNDNKEDNSWFDNNTLLGIIHDYYERNLFPFKDIKGSGKFGYGFVPVDDYDRIGYTASGPWYIKDGESYEFDLNWIIQPQYDEAEEFREGMAPVKINDKWRFIDMKGNFINSQSYDDIEEYDYGLAFVQSKEKWGLINNKGETLIEPKFDYVWGFHDGMARVKVNGKYGYVDTTGKLVVEPEYERAYDFSEGLARVETEKGFGYLDTLGEFAISPEWDHARDFHNGFAAVRTEMAKEVFKGFFKKGNDDGPDKWGYIDMDGNVVVKPQFFEVTDFEDNKATVYKTGSDYENNNGIPVEIRSGSLTFGNDSSDNDD